MIESINNDIIEEWMMMWLKDDEDEISFRSWRNIKPWYESRSMDLTCEIPFHII